LALADIRTAGVGEAERVQPKKQLCLRRSLPINRLPEAEYPEAEEA